MFADVFEFDDYKEYLGQRLPTKKGSRGRRAALAKKLKCQGAYISQVLHGPNHFSLEHAAIIDEFLGHNSVESKFFILLVHLARAGSEKLKCHYKDQLEELDRKRQIISERIAVDNPLSEDHQSIYYSAWYYSAIHVLVLIPQFQDRVSIAEYLNLPFSVVSEVCDYLIATGLIAEENGKFVSKSHRIHLGRNSSFIERHHANWRMRSIHALDRKDQKDLHFSGPIAISQQAVSKVRRILLSAIDQMEPIIANTTEEEAYGVCLDFFRI